MIGDRQPAPERPRRQERRRALHLRRSRRGDERRVDEGVLRADRGRLPARVRDARPSSAPTTTPTHAHRHERPRRAARAARPRCARCSSGGPRSRSRRSATRCRAGRGRSSATASTGSRPQEMRIKLSELCYKSIACDVTEDKKHIDLSAEPMILVCAAGLHGSNADDVGKEIAIYRAHKAAPIVIADDGEDALPRRARDDHGPGRCTPIVAFVLCAMVGPPVRLRGGARDRRDRPGRCARRAAASRRSSARRAEGDDLLRRARGRRRSRSPTASSTGCARHLRRRARSRDRGAARVGAALRDRCRAARRVPGRVRQGRHAEHRRRRPHRARSRRRSRS